MDVFKQFVFADGWRCEVAVREGVTTFDMIRGETRLHAACRDLLFLGGANRAQLLLAKTARDGSSRLVLRSPDPLCNPYIAYALIIEAAMEGILSRSRPGAPADLDLSKAPAELLHQYKSLPDNLGAAVELAEGSQFLKKHLALPVLEKVAQCKRAEWEACWKAKDRRQFEMASYFDSL